MKKFSLHSIAAVIGLSLGVSCLAQTTVLDGVYSDAQARKGKRTYDNICAECHEGAEPDADPLISPVFIDRWREAPLDFLYGFITREMPGNEPGTLSEGTYLDVVAYLLSANGYPAGTQLSHGQLGEVLLVGLDGPQPLPVNSLIRVMGCLSQDVDQQWQLDSASSLIRVRSVDDPDPDEATLAKAASPGEAIYRLRNVAAHGVDAMKGHRVQIKGVLDAQGPPQLVSVLSLQSAGDKSAGENCSAH